MKKILASIAFSLALAGPAAAQMKLQIGCTATSDCASAMVAVDEGIFKKHGLDVEMTPIGINSNIPAAKLWPFPVMADWPCSWATCFL